MCPTRVDYDKKAINGENTLQLLNFRYIQFGRRTLTEIRGVRFSHSVVNDNEPVDGHTGTSK